MNGHFLTKPFPYVLLLSKRLGLSVGLMVVVTFILIFMEPYDIGLKIIRPRNLLLMGYGFCVLIVDLPLIVIERELVLRIKRKWTLRAELTYHFLLFALTGILIYAYDLSIIKHEKLYWNHLMSFGIQFVLPFTILIQPVLFYIRKKQGVLIKETALENREIQLIGKNKEDRLTLPDNQLLFFKSMDNYVKIFYLGSDGKVNAIMMRTTLKKLADQAPFMANCHRSYMIDPFHIKELKGHKQNATLVLNHVLEEIPVSSTYFERIKNLVDG